MVVRLDNELWFPDPHFGEDDGCIAVGGDLSVDRLLLAYSYGIFPWYAYRYDDPVWYCPMQRFVIFPEEIHISHSMRTMMNKDKYQVSMNQAFDTVIETCGKLRENEDMGWLGPQMTEAYKELYRQGFAASVEVWEKTETDGQTEKRFVGGLYGVTIGNSFFGESMCSPQCLETGADLSGSGDGKGWGPTDRLSIRNPPSEIDGGPLYSL